MKTKEKTIYYKDEHNDDFARTNIKRKPLGEKFRYIHTNPFFRVFEFILYYIVGAPLVFLMQKLCSHQSFVNRKALRQAKKEGCFLYSNHTQLINDAYIGPLASLPRKCFVITSPDTTSIPGIRLLVQAMGAIPLGSSIKENMEMLECIQTRIDQGHAIMIYPEAHIWPYYTKIRDFSYMSFHYPVQLQKPVFVLTNCYEKRRFFKKPRIKTFVDGPFYPDPDLSEQAAAKALRNIAYETMCQRAKNHSTYEYIRYIKED